MTVLLRPLLALLPVLQGAPPPRTPELAALEPRWEQARAACGVGGLALVVVEGDEVLHLTTLGRRDPEGAAPVTPDTMFYIASATKPFVAFALMQQVEAGRLDLDAPVRRYLPRFRLADAAATEALTVRDLLCHRPGLHCTPIVLLDAYSGEISEDRYYHFLRGVTPLGRVSYSNVHFTLAGRVLEAVSGKPWRDALASDLFAPAGMTRTSGYASFMYGPEERYGQTDAALPALPVPAPGTGLRRAPHKSDATMHAAGGLGISIRDLSVWLRLQLGRGRLGSERLLSEAGIEETWRLQAAGHDSADFGPEEGFGLGWQRGSYRDQLELRHGGGYVGCSSYVCFLPEAGLGLAVVATGGPGALRLCQLVSTDVHEFFLADDTPRDPLPDLLEEARRAREREAATPPAAPGAQLLLLAPERYRGVYASEWLGTLALGADPLDPARLSARLGELELELAASEPDRVQLSAPGAGALEGRFELQGQEVLALWLELGGESVRFERRP